MTYLIYDILGEDLLAEHHDLDTATLDAEALADLVARDLEDQLATNGEGHPGGIPVTVMVHDADTGLPCAEVTVHTEPVPPRAAA